MRFAAATAVAMLTWTARSLAGPAPAEPIGPIEPGKNFVLRAGQSAPSADGALRVGFVGVIADSRCPKGVRCVWAGDATVQVWLRQGSGPNEMRELHTMAGAAQTARALGHDLRLVHLDPSPVNGKAVAQGDYAATLTLNPGPKAASDR